MKLIKVMVYMFRRFFDLLLSLDGLQLVVAIVFGIGIIGYFSASWAIYYLSLGKHLQAWAVIGFTMILFGAAALRIRIATYIVFGGAAIIGSLVLSGGSNTFMP
jgi:hypothetical protein